jgi:hypothetical protein
MKTIVPAFNCTTGGGLALGGLAIRFDFWFDDGLFLSLVV